MKKEFSERDDQIEALKLLNREHEAKVTDLQSKLNSSEEQVKKLKVEFDEYYIENFELKK